MKSPRNVEFLVMVLLYGVTVIFHPNILTAQVGTASLSGFVTDPSGAPIPNASVTLESVSEKYKRPTSTSTAGQYTLHALPPGEYKLVVEAPLFGTETRTGVSLSAGQASTLNVELKVGRTSTEITVSAAPPLLQTGNATLGTTVEAKAVTDL